MTWWTREEKEGEGLTIGEKWWFWIGFVSGVVLSAAIMVAGAILSALSK